MASRDEDDFMDDIPLHRQRPFGLGLYRKKVAFVPATSGAPKPTDASHGNSVADIYLGIVLSKESTPEARGPAQDDGQSAVEVCDICKLPTCWGPEHAKSAGDEKARRGSRHEASLVHQVCLAHSHPPSSLDRSRMGLSVLEAQGWDPDARQGLGVAGRGIQFPLKAKPKDDTLGLGVMAPKDLAAWKKERPQTLDAGKVRKMAQEDRKRRDRLRQRLYGSVDLEKYLGTGS